jgi:hypothetical protein
LGSVQSREKVRMRKIDNTVIAAHD